MTRAVRLDATSRAALLLVAGRTAGFIALFALPIVLVRVLTPAQFGTYRQLFLIYGTLYSLLQIGMAESLYYFIPREPATAGRAVANAIVMLGAIGAVAVAALTALAPSIARWMHNPALARGVPRLSGFLALMLVATTLEIVMVSRKRHRLAATTYALSDAVRAAALVIPAAIAHSVLALLAGALVFGGVRCVVLAMYLWREFRRGVRLDAACWRAQMRYTVPFAAAVTLDVVQLNYHQYAVSAWFDTATFAIYSVGCLQIPLVDLFSTSVGNVMMVRMGEDLAAGTPVIGLWHETIDKLALAFFPLVAVLLLTARPLIVVLFTPAYLASVPVFMVTATGIALAAFPVDSALRVFAQTRFLFVMNVLRLAIIVVGIAWFVRTFHLAGAVLVTVAATGVVKLAALGRIAQLMRVPWKDVLPWRALARTAAAAIVAAVPAAIVSARAPLPPLALGLVVGGVYAVGYAAIVFTTGAARAVLVLNESADRL